MKQDEFAFFNQQLAGMLQAGIPLEGALRQLCATMRQGTLRSELEKLESDLARGTPIEKALLSRNLPPFYKQMVKLGVQSNDLPGMLILVADYYQRLSLLQTRIKGLLVYPAIVLVSALALSIFISFLYGHLVTEITRDTGFAIPTSAFLALWMPPVFFGIATIGMFIALAQQKVRQSLRWRVAVFRDANVAQFAAAAEVMLRRGANLGDTFKFLQELERNSPAEPEIAGWSKRLSDGYTKFSEIGSTKKFFPPLFFWIVENTGEDLAAGFSRASEIYAKRAAYRADLLLFAALPVSVLLLGTMLVAQMIPFMKIMGTVFTLLTGQ